MAEIFWTIEKYRELVEEETASIDSPEFYGGTQDGVQTHWKLQLCQKDVNANISVYLKLIRSNCSAVKASFNVSLIDHDNIPSVLLTAPKRTYDYMNDVCGSGWLQLRTNNTNTTINTLPSNDFLREDDKLRVHCSVHSIQNAGMPLKINMPTSNCALATRFWAMYGLNEDTDMTIVVGQKEFAVHKIVFRSHSKVFDAMLEHDVEETTDGRVTIKDFDADTIEKLITFVYTGECGDLEDCATELLKFAEKYDIPALKSESEVVLVRKLSARDAPALLHLAEVHGAELLKKYTLDFIRDNLREVMTVDYWKMLPRPLVDEVMLNVQDAMEKK